MIIEIDEIKKLLPHRDPFLYLDKCDILEIPKSSSFDPNDTTVVTATHHDAPKYISNKAVGGTHVRPAPFINHTDAELKLLEAIVGREVPFGIESELYTGERREY